MHRTHKIALRGLLSYMDPGVSIKCVCRSKGRAPQIYKQGGYVDMDLNSDTGICYIIILVKKLAQYILYMKFIDCQHG